MKKAPVHWEPDVKIAMDILHKTGGNPQLDVDKKVKEMRVDANKSLLNGIGELASFQSNFIK